MGALTVRWLSLRRLSAPDLLLTHATGGFGAAVTTTPGKRRRRRPTCHAASCRGRTPIERTQRSGPKNGEIRCRAVRSVVRSGDRQTTALASGNVMGWGSCLWNLPDAPARLA